MRQIALVGFLQAQNCTTIPAAWRHPEARLDFTSPDYYRHIGRVLERGRFDLRLLRRPPWPCPTCIGGDHRHTVENGIRCVKMDAVTWSHDDGMPPPTRLGLGATYSTTYYEPFHVARVFQTVDLMTKGRAAWNVRHLGQRQRGPQHGPRRGGDGAMTSRYDRADEFMEIVLGHWDTWDDDALVVDQARAVYAHPDKVRRIDYKGEQFLSRVSLHGAARTPQGHPVVMQAGMSGRGRRFAARWGELLFVVNHSLEQGKAAYAQARAAVAAAGRDPDTQKICHLVLSRHRCHQGRRPRTRRPPTTSCQTRSTSSRCCRRRSITTFAKKGLDEAFTDDELEGLSGIQAIRDRVVQHTGNPHPTVRDFMRVTSRASLNHAIVGGPTELADHLEEWFSEPACDGFVIGGSYTPGTFEDFVELVVPELQRRGLMRTEYTGSTLRDHLGLDVPPTGAWKLG